MNNFEIVSSGKMTFTPVAAVSDFTVALGVAGYVDTDVSAVTGTDTTKLWVIIVFCNTTQYAGARKLGETADNKVQVKSTFTIFSYVDSSGHMELYRNATTDCIYRIIGHFS